MRAAPKRRAYGRDRIGRQVYEALAELVDREGHVIAPGELFLLVARGGHQGGTVPICGECRPVHLQEAPA